MLSQVVINQGNFALQNRAENVVQTVVHCFSIISTNKLKINKITPLSQSPLGLLTFRSISSVGLERLLDREEVTGSNPVWITKRPQFCGFFCIRRQLMRNR